MRGAFIVSLAAAIFAGLASLSAQQTPGGLPAQSSSAAGQTIFPSSQPATSFGSLFGKRSTPALSPPFIFTIPSLDRPAERLSQQPAVVCGMTLIPADPKLDSAIRHAVPDRGLKFAIRGVVPKDCRR
jgi:hypothetical protein